MSAADRPDQAVVAAAALLSQACRVWIGTHVDPDGDAVGSALGLAAGLRGLGKTVAVSCADRPPREAAFLPGVGSLASRPPQDGEVAVAVDAAEPGRLGSLLPKDWPRLQSVVIDHHASNPGYGTVDVIDGSKASSAEVVLDVLTALDSPIDGDCATCLLTGIITDTLGFRTQSTTAGTLAAAARLIELGARLGEITYHVFYTRPLAELKLTSLALERIALHGPFAITWLDFADLAAAGASSDATKGISGLLASADEPSVVALLRENHDGTIDVSLRAKPGVNLLPAASAMGGGGHPQAAGAKLDAPMAAACRTVLAALEAHVRLPAKARRRRVAS